MPIPEQEKEIISLGEGLYLCKHSDEILFTCLECIIWLI